MSRRISRPGGNALVAAALGKLPRRSGVGLEPKTVSAATLDSGPRQPMPRQPMPQSPSSHLHELRLLLPNDMSTLLSVLDGLESVIALKRSNRGCFVLFRGDKAGVETAANRTLKIQHFLQLKALLGDIVELKWVLPPPTQRARSSTPAVKDFDLGIRFSMPVSKSPLSSPVRPNMSTSIAAGSAGEMTPRRKASCAASPVPQTPSTSVLPIAQTKTPPGSPGRIVASRITGASRNVLLRAFVRHLLPDVECAPTSERDIVRALRDANGGPIQPLPEALLPPRPNVMPQQLSRSATPSNCALSPSRAATPSTSLRRGRQPSGRLHGSGSMAGPLECSAAIAQFASPSPSPSPAARLGTGELLPMYTPVSAHPDVGSRSERRSASADAVLGASRLGGENVNSSQRAVAARRLRFDLMEDAQPNPTSNVPELAQQGRPYRDLPHTAFNSPSTFEQQAPSLQADLSELPYSTPGKRCRPVEAGDCSDAEFTYTACPKTPKTPKTPKRGTTGDGATASRRLPSCPATPAALPPRTPMGPRAHVSPSPSKHCGLQTAPPAVHPSPRSGMFAHRLPLTTIVRTPRRSQIRTPAHHSPATPSVAGLTGLHTTPGSAHSGCYGTAVANQSSPHVLHVRQALQLEDKQAASTQGAPMSSAKLKSPGPLCSSRAVKSPSRSTFARPRRSVVSPAASTVEISSSGWHGDAEHQAPGLHALNRTVQVLGDSASCATLLTASIMDDDMILTMNRNRERTKAAIEAADVENVHRNLEQAARPRLPALFNHLRSEFERRRSLIMPWADAVAATMDAGLAPEGLSRDDAETHLRVLATAAPDWLTLESAVTESPCGNAVQNARIAHICTGVWERLVRAASA